MKKNIFIIIFFLKVSFAFGQVSDEKFEKIFQSIKEINDEYNVLKEQLNEHVKSIAYIDINFILNNSLAGKSLKENINFIQNDHLEKFNKIEKDLITKENNLNSKKNIIEKKEFEKEIMDLKNDIKNYRLDRNKSMDVINKIKINNTKKILKHLNPIITKYVEENSISIVLPKKNIIVGKKILDITDTILKLFNGEIKIIKF